MPSTDAWRPKTPSPVSNSPETPSTDAWRLKAPSPLSDSPKPPSTDAKRSKSEEDEGSGLAGTLLVGALVLLFVIAIVALIYFAVAG